MLQKIKIADDLQLAKVQDNIFNAFQALPFDFLILNGNFVEATIANVDTPVEHGLKRDLIGWVIVDKNANADVWKSATANPRPQDQIILIATASVAVKIYFF